MDEMFDSELPPIPKIQDLDLRHAVSALAQSADVFRKIFLRIMHEKDKDPMNILMENVEVLKGADAVIDKWLEEFNEMDLESDDIENPSLN